MNTNTGAVPLDIHVRESPDAVPLLRDGLHGALDGWRAAGQVLVVLLDAFNLRGRSTHCTHGNTKNLSLLSRLLYSMPIYNALRHTDELSVSLSPPSHLQLAG